MGKVKVKKRVKKKDGSSPPAPAKTSSDKSKKHKKMDSKEELAAAAAGLSDEDESLKDGDTNDVEEEEVEEETEVAPLMPTEAEILRGQVTYLPPRPSKTVRLYLLSNYTDFTVEKSYIMKQVFPEVRAYCQKHGLEFQLVDLGWAAREDPCTDQPALSICREELKASQDISLGPYVAILLGDKYGSRPYPNRIDAEEFQVLYDAGKAEGKDVLLLDDWYACDENAPTPEYILQSVTSRFPFFNDEAEGNRNRRKKDQDDWATINSNIAKIFRVGAARAYREGKLTAEQKRRYFRSELETEVEIALTGYERKRPGVICVMRSMQDIVLSDKLARRYTDTDGSQVNVETQAMLKVVKDTLMDKTPPECVLKYTIPWNAQGIVATDYDHGMYLKAITENFKNEIIRQINEGLTPKSVLDDLSYLGKEVLLHMWIQAEKSKGVLFGRNKPVKETQKCMFNVCSDPAAPAETESQGDNRETVDGIADDCEANVVSDVDSDSDTDTSDTVIDEVEAVNAGPDRMANDPIVSEGTPRSPLRKRIASDVLLDHRKSREEADIEVSIPQDGPGPQTVEQPPENTDIANQPDGIHSEEREPIEDSDAEDGVTENTGGIIPENEDKLDSSNAENKIDERGIMNGNQDGLDNDESDGEFDLEIVRTKETWESDVVKREVLMAYADKRDEVTVEHALLRELKLKKKTKFCRPTIIYGSIGVGKTLVLTQVINELESWFEVPVIKIIRFLGESHSTRCIRDTLVSLIEQIWQTYEVSLPDKLNIAGDFTKLACYFQRLLYKISSPEKPLVICLDAIEKLNNTDGAYLMTWLPLRLPVNVSMILTMREDHESFQNVEKLLPAGATCCVPIDADVENQCVQQALQSWTETCGRHLTKEQTQYLVAQVKVNKTPLLLTIGLEQAVSWDSDKPTSDITLQDTEKETMEKVLNDLEKNFSKTLVYKICGYLLCSRHGLSEAELEDALSSDDDMLRDVYRYYQPHDEFVIRMPQLAWQKLRHEIKGYLNIYFQDGNRLLNFLHPILAEPVAARYLTVESRKPFHYALASYFMGESHNVIKPFNMGKKKPQYPQCMRNTPAQTLNFRPDRPNMRKLQELPYQLVMSHRYTEFVVVCCRKFDWLYTQCKTFSLTAFLDELTFALKSLPSAMLSLEDEDDAGRLEYEAAAEEIQMLKCILGSMIHLADSNPTNMAVQLLGLLMGRSEESLGPGLTELREQALAWCDGTARPLLVPQKQCMPYPGLELQRVHRIHLYTKGDPYLEETKLCLSRDRIVLYVVEQQTFGNYLFQYDLQDGADLVSLQHLKKRDVKKIGLAGNDNYIHFELYDKRDRFAPQSHHRLLDRRTHQVSEDVPTTAEVFAVSSSGMYCAVRLATDPD